jgi:hypothetical protein
MRSNRCVATGRLPLCTTVAIVLVAGVCSAHAQTAAPEARAVDKSIKASDLRGEWFRAGAGFGCKVSAAKLPPDLLKPDILAKACLHMGPFGVGENVQTLTTSLGAPPRTLPQSNGATESVDFLEKPGQYPYLVATVSKGIITALQVTGPAPAKGYSFNHIDLGAPIDTLVQYFGQPRHLEPSSEKDTELWTYGLQPFSFEVRDSHVTSIRIALP